MSKKKLYFTTTEVSPFANVSSMAKFSEEDTTILQEKYDNETVIPKYGYISERKYLKRSN